MSDKAEARAVCYNKQPQFIMCLIFVIEVYQVLKGNAVRARGNKNRNNESEIRDSRVPLEIANCHFSYPAYAALVAIPEVSCLRA